MDKLQDAVLVCGSCDCPDPLCSGCFDPLTDDEVAAWIVSTLDLAVDETLFAMGGPEARS